MLKTNLKEMQLEEIVKILQEEVENRTIEINVLLNPKKSFKGNSAHRVNIELPQEVKSKRFKVLLISNEAIENHSQIIQKDIDFFQGLSPKELKKMKFTHCVCEEKYKNQIIKFAPMLGKLKIMPNLKDGTLTADVKTIINKIKRGDRVITLDILSTRSLKLPIGYKGTEVIDNIKYIIEKIKTTTQLKPKEYIQKVIIKTTQGKPFIINKNELF